MLGRYLAGGTAGDTNPVEAPLWLEQAAAQGVVEAQQNLPDLPAA
jgi:TPR repeat protein